MSINLAGVPVMETRDGDDGAAAQFHLRHATSSENGGRTRASFGQPHTDNYGAHPYEYQGKHIQPGYPSSVNQSQHIWNGPVRDAMIYRRPIASDPRKDSHHHKQHLHIGRTKTESTSTSTSSSGNGGTGSSVIDTDLWKVKLTGEFLESASYSSNEEEQSKTNHMLRRLKLLDTSDDEDDQGSITATTKVPNFAFQNRVQGSSSTRYFRPVDSLAKYGSTHDIQAPPPPPPLSTKESARFARSRGGRRLKDELDRTDDSLESSEQPLTIYALPNKLSSLSYNSAEYAIPTPTTISPYNSNSKFRRENLRKVALVKSSSESDDDPEFKRMESVTHTFQRNDCDMTSRNSKFSAIPLSGIGVDVRNDYNQDEQLTPREAANASCSFSFSTIIGDLLGVTPPKKNGTSPARSPFDIVKHILCTDEAVHVRSTQKKEERTRSSIKKENASEYADDWSGGVDNRSDSECRYTFDDGDRSESCLRSEIHSQSPSYAQSDMRSRRFKEAGRDDNPYRNRQFTPNRKSSQNNVKPRPLTLQEKYDKSLTSHYHREDMSYYGNGTDAGTSCYSSYSCADDDRSDTVSRMSGPFKSRAKYRDSPFVQRLKNERFDDQYTCDSSYR